ncbi:MAG: MtnX-like HAD-IB family phosphatase [Candidatus Zixiibacteriota bacterium]
MSKNGIIIFSDFDGTFAEKDIGYRIFKHFSGGQSDAIVKDWKAGLISHRDCLLREAELVSVSETEYYQFIDQFDLREGAREFYEQAVKAGIEFYLLSDGTDLYIRHILNKNELKNIKYFANKGRINGHKLTLGLIDENPSCGRCGSCKGERIEELIRNRKPKPQVIFIGDGLSDICALSHSDLIFARGDLLQYCRDEKMSVIAYKSFFDILNQLKKAGLWPD